MHMLNESIRKQQLLEKCEMLKIKIRIFDGIKKAMKRNVVIKKQN